MLHGADDDETPPAHSERVYQAVLAGPKKLVLVPGAHHNDALTSDAWRTFISGLPRTGGVEALPSGGGQQVEERDLSGHSGFDPQLPGFGVDQEVQLLERDLSDERGRAGLLDDGAADGLPAQDLD